MDYGVDVNPDPRPTGQVLHRLLAQAFSHMEGRIDPPSSMTRMDPAAVSSKCGSGDLVIARREDRVVGCLFAEQCGTTYHLGKIAVVHHLRQRGIARAMVEAAADRAAALGLNALQLQSRVELTENHAAFNAMGFRQSGSYTHPGFEQPTSLVFTRPLPTRRRLS
ncbi:MAG: GNAT family N-acetyltransferase [Pseudomonadota bacterium]